jgi:hypothetical protein
MMEFEDIALWQYENGAIKTYLAKGSDPPYDVIGLQVERDGEIVIGEQWAVDEALYIATSLLLAIACYFEDKIPQLRGLETEAGDGHKSTTPE